MWEHHRALMRATEGIRTFTRQGELYAQGRTAPGRVVTYALPGYSTHHYGIAVDSCFAGKNPYPNLSDPDKKKRLEAEKLWGAFRKFAQSNGLRCGGDWNGNGKVDRGDFDQPHVELCYGGMSIEQMLKLYKHGGLQAVWAEFDLIRGVEPGSEWYGPQKRCRLIELE